MEDTPPSPERHKSIAVDQSGIPIQELSDEHPDGDALASLSFSSEEPEMTRIGRFATVVNLVNTLIGAGVVGIPATFKRCGIGPTTILLLLSCALCYTCGNVIVGLQWDLDVQGIDAIARRLFAYPGKLVIGSLAVIFSLSCSVAYLIIGTGKITDWLSSSALDVSGTWGWALCCLVYAVVPCAFTIPRRVSFLSRIGPLSLGALGFYCVALAVKSGIGIRSGGISDSVIGYSFGSGLFSAFAVHALTFSLPIVMNPAIAPYNPNTRKRKVALAATYFVSWVFVAVPAFLAYLMKGAGTESDVLSSFEKGDVVIIIIQAAIFLKVTLSYPLIVASLVGSLGGLFWDQNIAELLTTKRRVMLIPAVNVVNVLLAMFLKDIQPVLGIGGALGGCIVVFAFPSLARLKIRRDPLSRPRNIGHVCLIVFGLASAAICAYYSVLDAIAAFSG
jgi:amino acid permease